MDDEKRTGKKHKAVVVENTFPAAEMHSFSYIFETLVRFRSAVSQIGTIAKVGISLFFFCMISYSRSNTILKDLL